MQKVEMYEFEKKKITWVVISTCIAIVSLFCSGFFAWYSNFRPAKVVGSISYFAIWCFSNNIDEQYTSRTLTPSFSLENVGSRPIIIEDIRLKFKTEKGLECAAYPNTLLEQESIENLNNYSAKGGLFQSFILGNSQKWVSTYEYTLQDDFYENLTGTVEVFIEILDQKNRKWETVIYDILDFGSKPFHLRKISGGEQLIIPIYTRKWKLRTEDKSSISN